MYRSYIFGYKENKQISYKKKQWRPPSKKKKRGKNLSPKNMKACHSVSETKKAIGDVIPLKCFMSILRAGILGYCCYVDLQRIFSLPRSTLIARFSQFDGDNESTRVFPLKEC
jgi:hypothetical protein